MNELLNDRKSIIKFVETNQQSLRNFRLTGDNLLSKRSLATNRATLTPRHDSFLSKKVEKPSYQLKTINIRHDSLLHSKDLRLKREEMAMKISHLIHEINLSTVKTKSGVKTLKMVLDFLRGFFDKNDAFQTMFDFLQGYVIGSAEEFPQNLVRHLADLNVQLADSFAFKDLWMKFSEQQQSNVQTSNFKSRIISQEKINERDEKISELTLQIKSLQRCLAKDEKLSASLKILSKEKFALTKELLEKRLELINQTNINGGIIRENTTLSLKAESLAIEKSELQQHITQLENQLQDTSQRFRKSQNKALQRKTLIGEIHNYKNSAREKLRLVLDTITSFVKVVDCRLEEPEKLHLTEFSSVKGINQETNSKFKPSRFSMVRKMNDSPSNARRSMRERTSSQQFNPVNTIEGFLDKKSIEELAPNRLELTPIIKLPKNLSKTDLQGLISNSNEPRAYEILSFLSKCEMSLFFAKNLHSLLTIVQSDIEKVIGDLKEGSVQSFTNLSKAQNFIRN
jgi:hypothetical protein